MSADPTRPNKASTGYGMALGEGAAHADRPPAFDGVRRIEENRDLPAIAELRAYRQWVAWRYKEVETPKGKKFTKPPVCPLNGRGASHSNPETWGSYDQARNYAATRKLPGVGFVLSDDDDFTGIDLDNCRNPDTGELAPWAQEIVNFGETYAEVSPSGAGLRLIARGKVEAAIKSDPAGVEIYGKQRYLTITADHLPGAPTVINPAPKTLEALRARVAEVMAKIEAEKPVTDVPPIKTAPPVVDIFAHMDGPKKEKPSISERARKDSGSETRYFRNVNDQALENLDAWFPALFPTARPQPGTGGYRVSSRGLGRNLEEDLSALPGKHGGIKDFGVHDLGDPRQGRRTPIDLVMEWGGALNSVQAALWLCNQIGLDPGDLGWCDGNSEHAKEEFDPSSPDGDEPQDMGGSTSGSERHPPPIIEARPYDWPDPSEMPRREWLYGKFYIRRYASATIAPGGVGKSSLTIAEAVAMVSGRPLLGEHISRPLNVWLWNGEDPLDELNRRIAGTFSHYGIRRDDCQGELFVNSGREDQIIVAKQLKGGLQIHAPIVDAVIQTIRANRIDVLIVDPFVSTHHVNENDNGAIDAVVRQFAYIADKTDAAIGLVHHSRKLSQYDEEVTVDAARGASSLLSAVRVARALNPMTTSEAGKAGLDAPDGYFRETMGKANMSAAASRSKWFKMESVDLGNGVLPFGGDSVGVVTRWEWPANDEAIDPGTAEKVKSALAGGPWGADSQASDWAGTPVAQALGWDAVKDKKKLKLLLDSLVRARELRIVRHRHPGRKERPYIEPICDGDTTLDDDPPDG